MSTKTAKERTIIIDVTLPEECRPSVELLRIKVQAANLLAPLLAISPFITILTGDPFKKAFTIAKTDWERLTDAVSKVDIIFRSAVYKIAQTELFYGMNSTHSHSKGSKVHEFWQGLADTFRPGAE